MFNNEALTKI